MFVIIYKIPAPCMWVRVLTVYHSFRNRKCMKVWLHLWSDQTQVLRRCFTVRVAEFHLWLSTTNEIVKIATDERVSQLSAGKYLLSLCQMVVQWYPTGIKQRHVMLLCIQTLHPTFQTYWFPLKIFWWLQKSQPGLSENSWTWGTVHQTVVH